jgi:hypothetical protein
MGEKVKLFHREPREVYRVYDAEEFLERADLELDAETRSRGGLIRVAGGLVLLLGALSVLTGLFASNRRLPVRGAAKQTFRGSRRLRAAISLGMGDAQARASHNISRGVILSHTGPPAGIGKPVRRSRLERTKRTVSRQVRSRPASSPMEPSQDAANRPGEGHLLVAAATEVGEHPQGEFGFER